MCKTAIIDMDSLLFAAFHGNKILDKDDKPIRTDDNSKFLYIEKTPVEIMNSCDFLMHSLLTKSGASGYISLVKGFNTTKSKEAVNDLYKADREKTSPKLWNFTKEYLKLVWNTIEVNNIETDDAVNICRLNIKDSFICAIDSDLLGLEGRHYNWKKDEWISVSKKEADYKFWSDMICGTHNNTKGIVGKGPAYVKRIFDVEHVEVGIKSYSMIVLDEYMRYYGEYEGVKQFNSNYICTKILSNSDQFITPAATGYEERVIDF